MFDISLIDLLEVTKKFMIERGWREHSCAVCGTTFFSKTLSKMDTSVCGWRKCDKKTYHFRTFTKRKKILSSTHISEKIGRYFGSIGFELTTPRNIVNFDGKTDLIIAGVQMFDDVIHLNRDIRKNKMFVAQPCVRMQFQQHIESQEGVSTSFVNVCSEQMNVEFDQHLEAVDHWCTILSQLGLHMNNFIVVMRTSVDNWGTGEFSALELFFSYGGLELGDAAYQLIPQANRAPISISDIGFGLERITWAVNKTDSYFDKLTPWVSSGTKEMFDSYRTIALLVLCGVRATNKGAGLQLRRFAKVLSEKYYGMEAYQILMYYFDYWAQFIEPTTDRETAVQLACLEIERFINLKISKVLKLPPPHNETTEAYLNRLVYNGNVSINDLRQVVQTCKK